MMVLWLRIPLYHNSVPYVNAPPHIGRAVEMLEADVLARWHRLLGEEVFFLTGTDEHGKKVHEAATKAGKTPQEFVVVISPAKA